MAIREGRWDCTQCGTKKIRGREMSCPGCGVKRASDTKFYLAEGEPEITDPEQIKRAMKGADWYCGYCQRGNQNDSNKCSQCGAERGISPVPRTEGDSDILTPATPRTTADLKKTGIGIASGVLFLIFLITYFAWPSRIEVDVTGFSWERSIEVQAYRTVVEEDWDIPPRGREISHRREVRSYNHVLDHYETRTRQVQTGSEDYTCGSRNLGNGYFEDVKCSRPIYGTESYQEPVYRDDPVYDTKYRYNINKWVHDRTETARDSEASTKSPLWPKITLAGTTADVLGNEREGSRSEKYIVHFISKNKKPKKYSQALNQIEWNTFEYGATYEAKLFLGNLSEFKPK